ncbi:expressed unknown protein [Seminavis robusta]|uniref:SAP domain-containing protein n=1 Tax=Seminavis robusta TaxID=568900 RepID=A0A9N8DVX4_9STRA|nr:expressed unknown protein [Seminavis robusta]|eukprot:Sro286_g108400.1 n/a (328) ;mRNA; f:65018-66001
MSMFISAKRRYDKQVHTWYSGLTVEKLKYLCKAAGLSFSGNKDVLIERLSSHHLGALFIWVSSRANPAGLTNTDLKEICEGRGIAKTGSRYELVCRILQHESNEALTAAAAAKAKKKRKPLAHLSGQPLEAKKPRISQPHVLYNRIQRKINSGYTDEKYKSYSGSRAHAGDVYKLLSQAINVEITDKGYSQKNPKKALELAKALFVSLTHGFQNINYPGYDNMDSLGDAMGKLETIVESACGLLSREEKTKTLKWSEKLSVTIAPYDFTNADDSLESIMAMLSVEESSGDDSDNDDRKPAASKRNNGEDAAGTLAAKENHALNTASH